MNKIFTFLLCFFSIISFSPVQSQSWEVKGFAPYFRHLNAVEILNNGTIVAAGGNPSNDAITSIFYSTDTANSWMIAKDLVNAMIKDIHFPTATVGYAVGNAGAMFKSTDGGKTWSALTLSGNIAQRTYNSVWFFNTNTGIAVGGNKSNDSIQTIIRTTDGGVTWNVITDNLGSWLNEVKFTDANNGVAVGDRGKILKTTDGGLNWTTLTVPGNVSGRQFNDLHFFNTQTGIVVGGFPRNDSIQTIIKTTDGGQTWNIISDIIASMLNTVEFINSSEGYTAGNDGIMKYSNDQGSTWTNVTITNSNGYAINDLAFLNPAFGAAVGQSGNNLIFKNTSLATPSATIETPVILHGTGTVEINGTVSANGASTVVEFEYGTSPSFGNTITMSPSPVTSSQQAVSAMLYALQPVIYYGRIKATNATGTTYSSTITFNANADVIPNFGFELWDSISKDYLQNWGSAGNLQQVTSYDGSFAAQVNANNTQAPGAIIFANVDNNIMPLPFTGKPDTINFFANYNIAANDTAFLYLSVKSGGNEIAFELYPITGNSNNQFQEFNVPVNYSSTATPDSMALIFISTNFFGGNINSQSVLAIDNVSLKGSLVQLPNSDMEQWFTVTQHKAIGWRSNDDSNNDQMVDFVVNQTTDSYGGDYALLLKNKQGNNGFANINTGSGNGSPTPDFPINFRPKTFNGYYKFDQDDNDTLFIILSLFKQGNQIGHIYHPISQSTTDYTLFNIPINYNSQDTPDSAHIAFSIHKNQGQGTPGNSSAWIDNLAFDAVIAAPVEEIIDVEEIALNVYPNPAGNEINIHISDNSSISKKVEVTIFDMAGKNIKTLEINTNTTEQIDISILAPQIYLIVSKLNGKIFITKIIKN